MVGSNYKVENLADPYLISIIFGALLMLFTNLQLVGVIYLLLKINKFQVQKKEFSFMILPP